MAYVKTWLTGATSGGTTNPEMVPGSTTYGLQVVGTGTFTTLSVILQGSLDGVWWFNLLNVTSTGLTWAVDKPVNQIRLLSTITGDGSQSVDASVIAV